MQRSNNWPKPHVGCFFSPRASEALRTEGLVALGACPHVLHAPCSLYDVSDHLRCVTSPCRRTELCSCVCVCEPVQDRGCRVDGTHVSPALKNQHFRI